MGVRRRPRSWCASTDAVPGPRGGPADRVTRHGSWTSVGDASRASVAIRAGECRRPPPLLHHRHLHGSPWVQPHREEDTCHGNVQTYLGGFPYRRATGYVYEPHRAKVQGPGTLYGATGNTDGKTV